MPEVTTAAPVVSSPFEIKTDYPLVAVRQPPAAVSPSPSSSSSLAKKFVDGYVDTHPKVVAARQRYESLYGPAETIFNVSRTAWLAGGFVALNAGLVALGQAAGQVAGSYGLIPATVAAFAAVACVTGLIVERAYERLYAAAVEPAKKQLEAAAAEIRGTLEGPEDAASVARLLAEQAAAN